MPTVTPGKFAELYLAIGNTSLVDSLNLLDSAKVQWDRPYFIPVHGFPTLGGAAGGQGGITFERKPTANGRDEQMDISITLTVRGAGVSGPGDTVIANEQAILKKVRQARHTSTNASLNTVTYLWARWIGSSSYVYWHVFDAEWIPSLPDYRIDAPIRVGTLVLHCMPYAQGDPVYDAVSPALVPERSTFYRPSVPGDVRALTHLRYFDGSLGGAIAQRLTLYTRSGDGFIPTDWTSIYPVTPKSPATTVYGTDCFKGSAARLVTSSTAWQAFGEVYSDSVGAYQAMADAQIALKVRDWAAPVKPPVNLVAVASKGSGNLGGGIYNFRFVAKDAGGHTSAVSGNLAVIANGYPTVVVSLGTWQFGGTYELEFGGQRTPALRPGNSASDVAIALQQLPTIGGNVTVTGANATNSIQRVNVSSGTGSFTLAYAGQVTPLFTYDSTNTSLPTAALVQSKLEQLSSIGMGNVVVTRSAGGSGSVNFDCEFKGPFAGTVPAGPLSFVGTGVLAAVSYTQTGQTAGPFTVSFPNPDAIAALGVPVGTLLNVNSNFDTPGTNAASVAFATPSNEYTINLAWSNLPNATDIDLYWNRNGGQYRKVTSIGLVTSYALSSETTGTFSALPAAAVGAVQSTLVRLAYGVSPNLISGYTDAVPCNLSNGNWEWLKIPTSLPLPPMGRQEGQSAAGWYIRAEALNTGVGTPNFDCDMMRVISGDGDAITIPCPVALSGPGIWDIDFRRDGRVSAQVSAAPLVTISGNPVDDNMRRNAIEGDHHVIPGGLGSWNGINNLIPNGGFELGTNYWYQGTLDNALTQIVVGGSSFFGRSFLLTTVTTAAVGRSAIGMNVATGGTEATGGFPVSANTQYTFSIYSAIAVALTGAGTLDIETLEWNAGGTLVTFHVTTISKVAKNFTRDAVTFTTSPTTTKVSVRLVFDSVAGLVEWDGAQIEVSNGYPTPYKETTNAPAVRNATRFQLPSAVFSLAQGMAGFRYEPLIANTALVLDPVLLDWEFDANNFLRCAYDRTAHTFYFVSVGAGVTNRVDTATYTFIAGDFINVMIYWTPSLIAISLNGNTFVTHARGAIPVGPFATTYDVASLAGTSAWLNGNLRSHVFGSGTPTNADALAYQDCGNDPPNDKIFTPGCAIQGWWSCMNGTYSTPYGTTWNVLGSTEFAGQLAIAPRDAIVGVIPEYLNANGDYVADVTHFEGALQTILRGQYAFGKGLDT